MPLLPSSYHPSIRAWLQWNCYVLLGSGDLIVNHLLVQILMDYITGKVLKNQRHSRVIFFFSKTNLNLPSLRYKRNFLMQASAVSTCLGSCPSFSSNWVPSLVFFFFVVPILCDLDRDKHYNKKLISWLKKFTTGGWWVKVWLLISKFPKAWECRKWKDSHYNSAFSAGAIRKISHVEWRYLRGGERTHEHVSLDWAMPEGKYTLLIFQLYKPMKLLILLNLVSVVFWFSCHL